MLSRTYDPCIDNETDDDDENESASGLRLGLARLGLIGLNVIVWLVAAVVALEWLAAREHPAGNSSMHLLHGEPGLGSKSLKVSPDGVKLQRPTRPGTSLCGKLRTSGEYTTLSQRRGLCSDDGFSPDGRFLVSGGNCLTFGT